MTQETKPAALISLPSIPEQFTEKKLIELFSAVESEAKAEVPDISTIEGRKRIKAIAAGVAKSKTAIDKPMRDYLREIKSFPKIIEKAARESVERFDNLKCEILKPLEEAAAQQKETLDAIKEIISSASLPALTSRDLKDSLSFIDSVDTEAVWPELKKEFTAQIAAAKDALSLNITAREAQESQAAEIERLRIQAEADALKLREAEIQRAAEEKARAEQLQAIARAELQRREAEEAARAAERAVTEAKKRAAEDAERARELAKAQAAQAAERAALDERLRLEAEEKQRQADAVAREQDANHRRSINRAALIAMLENGIDEATAKKAITLIATKKIPNIRIDY